MYTNTNPSLKTDNLKLKNHPHLTARTASLAI